MPKNSYQLINPMIEGSFQDVYDATKPINAAKDMWENLTTHIIRHVPKFMFTMRNISTNELHHFGVSENGDDSSFTIDELDINIDKKNLNSFTKNVDEYNKKIDKSQFGGKRHRYDIDKSSDSSSSSSSSSDTFPTIKRTSPISLFHYNARVYYSNPLIVDTFDSTLNPEVVAVTTPIFTPTFKPNLNTFVAIWP